jgi:glycosyltransferase involved in cell wall biosynthesis
LISCIMPTANRPHFVAQAIRCWARQTYPDRELVILDDGVTPVPEEAAALPGVRLHRAPPGMSLGAKRNLLCELAQGDVIAHWDDDDWHGPERLSHQFAALEAGAEVVGARDLAFYAPLAAEAWRFQRQPQDGPGLCGGTLMYRRKGWARAPFADRCSGEDEAFVRAQPSGALRDLPLDGHYIAVLHRGNTAAKSLRAPRWQRAPLEEVARWLRSDREFYATLRGAPPRPAAPPAATLRLVAPFCVHDGYGAMAEHLALGLEAAGAKVEARPIGLDRRGLTPDCLALLDRASSRGAPAETLLFTYPQPALEPFLNGGAAFYTMWEGDRIPTSWRAQLAAARHVVVPSRFLPGVLRDSGIATSVSVVPLGVDPAIYAPVDRPEREGLTTLIVATNARRKHLREAIAAWREAFAGDPAARLILKGRFDQPGPALDDPRIRFESASLPSRGIAGHYAAADVLMALGNEGFGLPAVEAMATGLPVVLLDAEGQADLCRDAHGLVLPVPPAGQEPADDSAFGPGGHRAVPDVAAAARQLRWVAEHPAEARAMGAAAAAWARRHRDVARMAPAVLDAIERAQPAGRPLRPQVALWVPSLGARCGIAEYGAALADVAGGVRAVGAARDAVGAAHLHLEHEFGIVDGAAVGEAVRTARALGRSISATVHSVLPTPIPREAEMDALVALTARGAAILTARNPGKPCLHIPHGCPTWFPRRKAHRGRVIGAFGFLTPQKGFFELLDAVRNLPGASLLLVAHARDPAMEAAWEKAACGVPVRRIGGYPDAAAAARLLAAEADLLAYPYREAGLAYASGAVTVGLATGVPVLASTAACFDDLGEAVWRTDDLHGGLARMLDDTALRERTAAAARAYCHDNDWATTTRRHRALWSRIRR